MVLQFKGTSNPSASHSSISIIFVMVRDLYLIPVLWLFYILSAWATAV